MTKLRIAILFVVVGGLATASYFLLHRKPEDGWKKVKDAEEQGLPATAIKELDKIYVQAMANKAYPEALKALSKKITLEGVIEGNKAEERIVRMQQAINDAPKEMVPVMDALLANWYLHYFHQNRWRFVQRSETTEQPSDDILTWDLKRIMAQIDKQFNKALSAEKELKQIPIADYDALLEKGSMPDKYRPTLYDFIAQDALNFYNAGEHAGSKAEDAFELSADSPIFGSAKGFMEWDVKTTDVDSHIVKAIRLYQQLLRFHEADADQTAYLDVELARIIFGHNQAFGEEKNSRFKASLQDFIAKNAGHELSAEAQFRVASLLQTEGDYVRARQAAAAGEKAYPASAGGKKCFNLIQDIETKSATITTERVWNKPWPGIQVRYKNVTKAYFRMVKADWTKAMGWGGLSYAERQALTTLKPDYEWSADLPPTADFQERTEIVSGPKELPLGYYRIIASLNREFSDHDNAVSFTDVWVSNLSIVMRNRDGEAKLEGFVLDAVTGEPIVGASVSIWKSENGNRFQVGQKVNTDKDGLFSAGVEPNRHYLVQAEHQGDRLVTSGNDWVHNNRSFRELRLETIFFMDRAIYRPGQTISYKGICIRAGADDVYQTIANQRVEVHFDDPNGKNIAKQVHVTNDYGSFAGSFTAPRDRLMGMMTIRVQGGPQGAATVRVEEYKRPKFQVTLDKPKVATKLDGAAELVGKATAYTGAAIDGAKVKYRVVREVRYPDWIGGFYWWRIWPSPAGQEIAHGTSKTNADGMFPINFVARPDRSVPEKDEPTFQYTVFADVTDSTGETRSGQQSLRVGYTALKASLSVEQWQTDANPVEVKVRTATLDDEAQAAKVKVKVFALKQPEKAQRNLLESHYHFRFGMDFKPAPDPTKPDSWDLSEEVASKELTTENNGEASASFKLPVGVFRVTLEGEDRFGKKIAARQGVKVIQPDAKRFAVKLPYSVNAAKWTLQPGEELSAVWGSGYDKARAFVEVEHRRKILKSYWTDAANTQQSIQQAVTEEMRGGFTLRVTMVRENRLYLTEQHVDVPWSNKNLTVKWEHFVQKLEPAQKETFTAIITGPDAKRAVCEMVAALYDESLDQFVQHNWLHRFNVFRQDFSDLRCRFENYQKQLEQYRGNWEHRSKPVEVSYRHYPGELIEDQWAFFAQNEGRFGGGFADADRIAKSEAMPKEALHEPDGRQPRPLEVPPLAPGGGQGVATKEGDGGKPVSPDSGTGNPSSIDLSKVTARKNLNETAFFYPQLISTEEGVVKLVFTMPEALTQWKFLGFVHDKQLRSGFLQDKVVTAKDLMIQPNAPRFVREGDLIEFTVKVSNQSEQPQRGNVRLTLADARTGKSVDELLGITKTDQAFDVPARQSKSFSWKMHVPDGLGPVTYKAVGSTEKLSDGEEGAIPTLSRRVLVTESIPLPIRGIQTKKIDFAKLRDSATSPTIQHQSLTVQMVSQPAWYAVMALPYLMEYPYECAEQQFNRYYANALARHIAQSDPKIRRIFDAWKNTPALDSPLEKNQDLKLVMLEETPWYRQAQAEKEARRNVGILFDDQRLTNETTRILQKLKDTQLGDGLWPWFPGGRGNEFISLYIATGFGRLRNLGVAVDMDMATQAWAGLDAWLTRMHQQIMRLPKPNDNHLSQTIALYLYGRSFFLKERPIAPEYRAAFDYFIGQGKAFWLKLGDRQPQAQLALGLHRFGEKDAAQAIMKSIRERSKNSEEMGMYWRDTEMSQWWYRAPIETQAMMIEAFAEVANDAQAVEDCKVWLLKQKQTQDWKTTKATADAVYALLLRGENLLKSEALVEVTLGDTVIQPEKTEAGTGFYEQRFIRGEVRPIFGNVQLKKTDEGVAWGSLHWQYLEDISKVTPHTDNPLKLKKTLWLRKDTKKGRVIEPIQGEIDVGDEIVVRVELRSDRDMEYVHLKDGRGSGTEPVNVLSRYRYQDGLGYYETTRDVASHFFIDYLPKGTYVFEYSVRAVHKGKYQTGMAEIQCMYAPEFNSHSESLPLEVK
jgi:uncharacterized protein YfaS (alpha-2-macroglobulin family)